MFIASWTRRESISIEQASPSFIFWFLQFIYCKLAQPNITQFPGSTSKELQLKGKRNPSDSIFLRMEQCTKNPSQRSKDWQNRMDRFKRKKMNTAWIRTLVNGVSKTLDDFQKGNNFTPKLCTNCRKNTTFLIKRSLSSGFGISQEI